MGKSPNVNFPSPSPEERELQRTQLDLLKRQGQEFDAFKPHLLNQYGLKEVLTRTPAAIDYQEAVNAWGEGTPTVKFRGKEYTRDEFYPMLASYTKKAQASPEFTSSYESTDQQKVLDEKNMSLLSSQADIGLLQAERLKKSLKGELPISEGTTQRKLQEFAVLKEQAARAGNPIFGDTPENAFSSTTSGQQSLKSFRDQWNLVEDAERRGEIQYGFGNLGSNVQTQGGQQSLLRSGIPDLGTGRQIPGYVQALQPYQFDRQGQYQAGASNANYRAQREAGIMSLTGQVIGTGAGAAMLALSSEKYKKGIKGMKDEKALSSLRKTKIYKFNYKDEPYDDKHPAHIGMIAEKAPEEVVSEDGEHIDVMSAIGMLASSIRALDKKISGKNKVKVEATHG